MHLIILNINNEYYFREKGIHKTYYVQSMYYKIDKFDDELRSELETAIIRSNGDNITTSIQSLTNFHFVEINLLNRWASDYIESINYDEPNMIFLEKLESWLDKSLIKADHDDVKTLFTVDDSDCEDGYIISIRMAECSNFAEPIIEDLNDNEVVFRIIKSSRNTYNAGAGSFGEGILIWIAKKCGDLAWDVMKKHVTRFSDRANKVEIWGFEGIITFIEENYHVSRLHLILKDASTLDNGDIQVTFSTYYQDFTLTCDSKLKIKGVKLLNRTSTRI